MPFDTAPDQRPLILLVEDDDAVRRSLHMLLAAHGYRVLSFGSGTGVAAQEEALHAACLIADLVIPERDGLDLLRDLRGAGWIGPAILISAHLTEALVAAARAQGYDLVLPKPLGDAVLTNAVTRLLPPPPAAPPAPDTDRPD